MMTKYVWSWHGTLNFRWGPQSSTLSKNLMLLSDNFYEIFELLKCMPVLIIIAMVDYIEPCLQEALDVSSWLMPNIHLSLRKIWTLRKQISFQHANVPLFLQHSTFYHDHLPSTELKKQTYVSCNERCCCNKYILYLDHM